MTRAATGPQRSDAEIFAQARKALDNSASIPETARVHVDGAVVWLTGVVRRISQRTEAEQLVQQIAGVKQIVNKITVSDERRTDDPDMTET